MQVACERNSDSFTNYRLGDILLIELEDGHIIQAEFRGGTENKMHFINTKDIKTGHCIPGFIYYYNSQIISIRTFQTRCLLSTGAVYLSLCEFERLNKLCVKDHVYLPTMDSRFVKGVNYLLECENIGVVAIGSELGRKRPINLLIMCSWDMVYIFDLYLFQQTKFSPELKSILESTHVKKIIHDSRTLVDCLHHRYDVKLNNIFDTAVADLLISKKQSGEICDSVLDISRCVEKHLNLPASLLEIELLKSKKTWSERPLHPSHKTKYVQLAVYLITLKNCLEKKLLADYCKQMDNHISQL